MNQLLQDLAVPFPYSLTIWFVIRRAPIYGFHKWLKNKILKVTTDEIISDPLAYLTRAYYAETLV